MDTITIKDLRHDIKIKQVAINTLKGQIVKAETFEEKEVIENDVSRSDYELARLQKKLLFDEQKAQEKARDKAHQAAVKEYNVRLVDYLATRGKVAKLQSAFVEAVNQAQVAFDKHYKTASKSSSEFQALVAEAERLGIEPLTFVDYCGVAGDHSKALCDILGGNESYLAKIMKLPFLPIIKGGWIATG